MELTHTSLADRQRVAYAEIKALPLEAPHAVWLCLYLLAMTQLTRYDDRMTMILMAGSSLDSVFPDPHGAVFDPEERRSSVDRGLPVGITYPMADAIADLRRDQRAWYLVEIVKRVWQLPAVQRMPWLTSPVLIAREWHIECLQGIAALTSAIMPDSLLVPSAGVEPIVHADQLMAILACANGPTPIPAQMLKDSAIQSESLLARITDGRTALIPDMNQATFIAARAIATPLLTTDNPQPRHMGRAMTVLVDSEVMPQLHYFEVASLEVVPERGGLWVLVRDAQDLVIGGFWWMAHADQILYCPTTMMAQAWIFLHATLAALWHDLCANAEIVTLARPTKRGRSGIPKQRPLMSASVYAPARKYEYVVHEATWADEHEYRTIREAQRCAHFYRLLPEGWQERSARPDFQQRRRNAEERAAANGHPSPPEGFTYVSPHLRGGHGELPAQRTILRAQGLYQLALAVKGIKIGTTFDDD